MRGCAALQVPFMVENRNTFVQAKLASIHVRGYYGDDVNSRRPFLDGYANVTYIPANTDALVRLHVVRYVHAR